MWQDYQYPESVSQAVDLLSGWSGQARIVAGGTDLVLQLKRGERQTACLVDVSRIEEMRGINEADGLVTVGSAVTHAEIATSPLIEAVAPVLAQAASEVGSPEIRNVATIGGNVVNAQPAADTALALLALEAEAEVVGGAGSRWVPLLDLYVKAGVSAIDSTAEIVRGFRFKVPAGRVGSAYRRLGKCKSIALPVLCAATIVRLDEDQIVSTAISLGPVAPLPFRARAAERWLAGQPASVETLERAAELAQAEAQPRDSLLRCARVYREAMVSVLVQSTLKRAVSAARAASGGAS
ncbi:MAG: FAD binding domain-containing protein [Anaerolineae bacterium]|jgi:carbon-monoxide dehydrogenase medium subunit